MKTSLLLALALYSFQLTAQWQAFTPNIPDTVGIKAVDAVNEQTAWALAIKYAIDSAGYHFAGHDKGYFFRTTDGGTTWSDGIVPMGQMPYLNGISAINANTAWVSGLDFSNFSNHVAHTNDGGLTWTPQLTQGFQQPTSYVNFVHFWDAQNGIVGGDPSVSDTDTTLHFEIWTTSNGGQNWTRVPAANIPPSLPDEYGLEGNFSARGQYIWFTSFIYSATPMPDRIFRSADKGLHWEVFEANKPYLSSLSFANDSLGATAFYDLATGSYRYQITQNGGVTWTDITPTSVPLFSASFTMVPGSGALVLVLYESPIDGPFTTLVSKDLGVTWQQIGTGELAGWAAFASPTAGYAGEWQPTGHATRLYRYSGSPLSGLLSGQPLDARVEIFPNPTSEAVTIQVKTAQPADFLLLLNDSQGRLLQKQTLNPGSTEFATTMDLHGLPSGNYFLTVTCAEGYVEKAVVKH